MTICRTEGHELLELNHTTSRERPEDESERSLFIFLFGSSDEPEKGLCGKFGFADIIVTMSYNERGASKTC